VGKHVNKNKNFVQNNVKLNVKIFPKIPYPKHVDPLQLLQYVSSETTDVKSEQKNILFVGQCKEMLFSVKC
jgi:hypothetical protein